MYIIYVAILEEFIIAQSSIRLRYSLTDILSYLSKVHVELVGAHTICKCSMYNL